MRRFFVVLMLIGLLVGCQNREDSNAQESYLRWVGDIEKDTLLDDAQFELCNGDSQVIQYFNTSKGPQYSGEKPQIIELFKNEYKPLNDKSQNGMVRIRFIVNCNGNSGRFRIIQSDYNYEPFEFKEEITEQLLNITKSIEKWEILMKGEKPVDYYMYMVFKIKDGNINEILP